MDPEQRQQISTDAKSADLERPGGTQGTAGDTIPGSMKEGLDQRRTQMGGGIDQAELDAEMEELEAPLSGDHVGVMNGVEVGTPAGRPLPGTPSR